MYRLFLAFAFLWLVPTAATLAAEKARLPLLLDTDIGTDVDDAFALALILASPELDLQGVTTVGSQAEDRAWLVCRFLTQVGRTDIPVAFGRPPQPHSAIEGQIQYRRHPAVVWNRTSKPRKESAVELLYQKLKAHPGQITLLALGPLTNIARLLKEHPDAKPWIKRLVLMGGSVHVGYNGKKPPEPEWNIKLDIPAAQAVFRSGVPLTVAPLDATAQVALQAPLRERLFGAHTMLTYQVQSLYELWDKETPILFDPVAVALAIDEPFCKMDSLCLEVDDKGMTRLSSGKPQARVATAIRAEAFLKWYVERVRAVGREALPRPPLNRSHLVDQGGFPNRVHTFEDYDTDIERRWWMSGKPENKNVPPGGRRACRAVLTQDFDDRMGDRATMYRAVIFNPVPGPPMGKNTRLSFRYRLHGTRQLRIQLYSLSKGYHRYLSLDQLPTDRWETATVDMTAMRRPDGSGGALAEDERIDDIQFYIDPCAELLIDDVILYDAALPGEKRPFPQRILFTGWFDTGKQGQEWPGDFEIVPHEKPRTWKTARSVLNKEKDTPWIRLSLRGDRRLAPTTELFFRYRLTGAGPLRVELFHKATGFRLTQVLEKPTTEKWAESTLSFRAPDKSKDLSVDEIRFHLPRGSQLWLDDVLLYQPGENK